MMFAKPSVDLGSRYLEAKPLNAICGRIVRDSRFVCVEINVSMVSPCGNNKVCSSMMYRALNCLIRASSVTVWVLSICQAVTFIRHLISLAWEGLLRG